MRKYCVFLLMLVVMALPVQAASEAEELLTATVPVPDQSDSARSEALRRALEQVMVRVAGDPQATQLSGAGTVLDEARALMQEFGYEQGDDEDDLRLRARFDGPALARAMRGAGLPVWRSERPQTVVWLALGDRLLTADGPEAATEAVRDAASARGIRVGLPRGDEADSGRVTVSDIRNGNDTRLTAVSRGYQAGYLLVGDARGGDGGWRADWRLLDEDGELDGWSDSATDRDTLVGDAVRRAADAYAQRFAVRGDGSVASVLVGFEGVGGAGSYTRISRFLSDLTTVEASSPVVLDGESVVFRVEAAGGLDALDQSIGLTDWLASDDKARNLAELYGDGGPSLGYRFSR